MLGVLGAGGVDDELGAKRGNMCAYLDSRGALALPKENPSPLNGVPSKVAFGSFEHKNWGQSLRFPRVSRRSCEVIYGPVWVLGSRSDAPAFSSGAN